MRKTTADERKSRTDGQVFRKDPLNPVLDISPDNGVDVIFIDGGGLLHNTRKVSRVLIAGNDSHLIQKRNLRIRDNKCRKQCMRRITVPTFDTADMQTDRVFF